jgi:hypothetical protein
MSKRGCNIPCKESRRLDQPWRAGAAPNGYAEHLVYLLLKDCPRIKGLQLGEGPMESGKQRNSVRTHRRTDESKVFESATSPNREKNHLSQSSFKLAVIQATCSPLATEILST